VQACKSQVVLFDAGESVPSGPSRSAMEFHLIYDGPLSASGRSKGNTSEEKHAIRIALHPQLKRLWEVTPVLREWEVWNKNFETQKTKVYLAQRFKSGEHEFVPLVFQESNLGCALDILFLRYDQPGETLIQSGDIDNRIKILFDALRIPRPGEYIGRPEDSSEPTYCLLEDDSMISRISVATDYLLEPNREKSDVRLIITVKVWPVNVTIGSLGNIGF